MPLAIREGDELAAVDLGSNSFHLVVARYEHGQPRVIDRLRVAVRLAAGVDEHGLLAADKRREALTCLSQFGQRLRDFPHERVWVVCTQAIRKLKSPRAFLVAAETALGHPVEVVSGREEARLIYLGVAHGIKDDGKRRLVLDIGGASTELIIGEGFESIDRESVQMGCVATTQHWFADGTFSRKRYESARLALALELQQFAAEFRARGWLRAYGSSGTIRATGSIARAHGHREGSITPELIEDIRARILKAGNNQRLDIPGLPEDRRSIFVGGFAVLDAVVDTLGIEHLLVAETAMREGLLYDMLGRAAATDPRAASIAALGQRYGVDPEQAERVEQTALALFDQVATAWKLDDEHRIWLQFAARVHEIGLAIAHSQHHHHAEYLLQNSDLAGFTRMDQEALAVIVRGHRRHLPVKSLRALPPRLSAPATRVTLLLRLAALLHRSRIASAPPAVALSAHEYNLDLALPRHWLEAHPLTGTDLQQEREMLAAFGITLTVSSLPA
ncbi:MAG: exopolyphosphatase [Lysobacterales bacterium]